MRDPGFTPGVRDIAALVDFLADDDLTKFAERALGRGNAAALDTLQARFEHATPPLRPRILRAIGRLADLPGALATLVAALDDKDPKTRRNAAIALGHARADGVEEALLRAWDRDPRPEMRRSIAASLGKIGSASSLPLLREAARSEDTELARVGERAEMMLARTESRATRGRIDSELVLDPPVDVEALSRRGLEDLLLEELAHAPGIVETRVVGPGRVRARLVGAMRALFVARTMLSFRFPLPTEWLSDGQTLEDAIAHAVATEGAQRTFSGYTVGPARYRIAWAEGGHKRAVAWGTARAIARSAPALVNDPTASLWEIIVTRTRRFVDVAIAPRGLDDRRFSWRRRDVPAATHPTVAAALARVAGARDDDVVWDPFVGSAGELIERARAGPYAALRGSDIDPRALAAARENVDAAGVVAHLELADALTSGPPGVTLVITNPPMGRRASRIPSLAETLDRFVAHAASVLVAGGRLVWIAPWPQRSRAAAARAGLVLDWSRIVDMGGFDAEMQRWIKKG
jgi:23S rRNA G2445 N2-methylase RlmL